MKKEKPVLVDLQRLRGLIAKLDLGDENLNDCLDARWVNHIEWWDSCALPSP
jgi:hypothetical protein